MAGLAATLALVSQAVDRSAMVTDLARADCLKRDGIAFHKRACPISDL